MILIVSEEQFYINEYIEKQRLNFSNESVFFINDETDLSVVINDVSSISLFGDPKLFIFDNLSVFYKKKIENKLFLSLKDALRKNDVDTFIFVAKSDTMSDNDFANFVVENSQKKLFNKVPEKSYPKVIKEYVEKKGGQISLSDASYLMSKLVLNLEIVFSELDKLLIETKTISKLIIDTSIGEYEQESNFKFTNSIEYNDLAIIYNNYAERKRSGDSIQLLIAQISQLLILSNKVFSLIREGLSPSEASKRLNVHQFRVIKANQIVSKLSISKIRTLIKGLAQIDYDIKVRGVNDEKAFELFLIKEFSK